MSTALDWQDKPVKYLRDTAVEQLQWNLEQNHLELEEYEQLVTVALSTASKAELQALTADLPARPETVALSEEQKLAVYDDTKSITSVLSESKQTGIWTPSKHLRVLSALSDTKLDFRDVRLEHPVHYVTLNCWLSEVKIVVPPDVNVVSQVKTVLGSSRNASRGKMNPHAPTLVIEGKVVLGELKITAKE